VEGASNCRQLIAGHRFTIANTDDGDGDYVLVSVTHEARPAENAVSDDEQTEYSNRFTCVPVALPYRPPRTTPRPFVHGCQTAVVVGPAGEEIYPDKYGRVKVQFHWDREGKNDSNSSCWIRVATMWAGRQWGAVHIPRIGQEVVVDFLEGDPDRPLIVGSVYNADNMPPYTLPANKTQSGIKSRSTLQGGAENFNELRFEDKKGSEQIFLHAEKDHVREVENDERVWVGNDRTKEVDGNETVTVKKDRTETVDKNETLTIHENRSLTVDKDQTVTIHQNETVAIDKNQDITIGENRTTNIGKNESLTVGKDRSTDIGSNDALSIAKKLSIEAGQEIEITTGEAKIVMKMDGTIQISGVRLTVEGMASVDVKAPKVNIKGDGMVQIQGAMVKINGDGMVQVKAPMSQVNGDGLLMAKGGVTMIN
jgi:type VI secretion system secreted protein VgrG